MPGRKHPVEREEDRDHAYRMQEKRSLGEDHAQADDAPEGTAELSQPGDDVAREREEYAQRRDLRSKQDL